MDSTPLQAWLDFVGLPRDRTRAELAAQYGISADNPYQWDLVAIDLSPPPLDGMLWPFGFQAFSNYSPSMPPTTFATHIWIGDDAAANIAHAAQQLFPHFGQKLIERRYNTLKVEWRWGRALVTLTVWPPHLQTWLAGSNPAHERDPRLIAACSVEVNTGWLQALSEQEQDWISGFEAIGPVRQWLPASTFLAARQFSPIPEPLLEFLREPVADIGRLQGQFGVSERREALIVADGLLYVIATRDIVDFEVRRLLPAKGGGGSSLIAQCATGMEAVPTKFLTIAQGERADDLNAIAQRLASILEKPVRLCAYEYDA